MHVSYELLTLDVLAKDHKLVESRGAFYYLPLDKWCCDPARQESFKKWINKKSEHINVGPKQQVS